MNHFHRIIAFSALAVFSSNLAAQDKPAPEKAKLLTPEATLNLRAISDLEFSPDGKRLVFVVAEPRKGDQRARHIWVYEKSSGEARQFTYSEKSENLPHWSPDGKQLAFLSNRGEQKQIYLMHADGGEALAITKGKRDIDSFSWSPDGQQIAFIAPDAPTDAEEKKEKDKDDARVADKDEKRNRVWLLHVKTGETRALTPSHWLAYELAWLASGERLILNATEHPGSDREEHRIYSLQISDGTTKLLASPNSGHVEHLRVSPDGKTIGYVGVGVSGPQPNDVLLLPINGGAPRNVTGGSLDRPISEFEWLKDGALLAVYADGFRNKFVLFTADGVRKDPAVAITTNPGAFAVSSSGEVAFPGQTATTPQELRIWDQKTPPQQVTHLNSAWKEFALSSPEYYKYKSFDGVEIEAAFLKPAVYDGKSKLPLVALIHGGPTGNWEDMIEPWGQLLVARGYAVFYPNIRGSTGYGEKFVEMNRGDWGGADFKDVMAGIDDLIARGIADPEKLGIGGWSYGGYMSEWAITQTTRFKAAVSGAGMANLISEFGTEDDPAYDEWFYGVPYEKPEGFLNSSPFLYLKNAKTPILILQGDADTIDPLGQSQELYRGLKHYGVEAELVVYPREKHGFQEEKHLLDRLNRILAWYDKHLQKAGNKAEEAKP